MTYPAVNAISRIATLHMREYSLLVPSSSMGALEILNAAAAGAVQSI